MILSSISPRRSHHDPAPYLWPDGTRTADGGPLEWVGEGDTLQAVRGADYAPRLEPPYRAAPHHPVNPILDAARDTWDDDWGSALAWAFPCCSVLAYLGEPVPAEWGFRSSYAGPIGDLSDGSYEAGEVVDLLGLGTVESGDDGPTVKLHDPAAVPFATWTLAAEYARHAATVLMRLADSLPESARY